MAQIIKEVTVDVAKKNLFQAIVAKQYDSDSRFLRVTLVNEDVPITVDIDSTVLINAERADGAAKPFRGRVNDDGTVTVPLANWMLELDDVVTCYISIIDAESRKLTSTSFFVEVEHAANLNEDISDDKNYDILLTLIGDANAAASSANTATTKALNAEYAAQGAASAANLAASYANEAAAAANKAAEKANSGTPGTPGKDGKSAYAYAVDGGYTGSESEFAAKLASETSGIHVGTDAPTDESKVWIDTDEEPSDDEGGGTKIDVVAKAGQVIAVKAVDENSKPTEYKAVDLPKVTTPDYAANEGEDGHIANRTHYVDENGVVHKLDNKYIDADWMATSKDGGAGKVVLIPEQTVVGGTWSNLQGALVEGDVYAVEVNGILYRCVCQNDGDGALYLGNGTLLGATGGNDEPFAIAWLGVVMSGLFFYKDGTLDDPIGIKVSDWQDTVYNKLPEEFLPDCVVKGNEKGVLSWTALSDKPFVEGAGDPFFTYTATFATDTSAKNGVLVSGASVTITLNTVYWLEVNGELLNCHWESESFNFVLYDEDGNEWVTNTFGGVYVSAQTAGTYTFKLYAPSDKLMLDPQYLPSNLAKKSEIPDAVVSPSVAEVGQTIIVEEVDADGKPTKWKAVDYQPRTHWQGEKVMLPEKSFESTGGFKNYFIYTPKIGLTVGKTYIVTCNGVNYTVVPKVGKIEGIDYDVIWIGNPAVFGGTNDDTPFAIADVVGFNIYFATFCASGTWTISITGEDEANTIPVKYLTEGFPYTIIVQKSTSDDVPQYFCGETVTKLTEIFNSGREIKMLVAEFGTNICYCYSVVAFETTELGFKFVFTSLYGITEDTPLLLELVPNENGTYTVQTR